MLYALAAGRVRRQLLRAFQSFCPPIVTIRRPSLAPDTLSIVVQFDRQAAQRTHQHQRRPDDKQPNGKFLQIVELREKEDASDHERGIACHAERGVYPTVILDQRLQHIRHDIVPFRALLGHSGGLRNRRA